MKRLFGLALLAACSGPDSDADLGSPLAGGWPDRLAGQPASFVALLDRTGRDGWASLHRADYPSAAGEFAGRGLVEARAWWEMAAVEDDLARLAAHAWPTAFQEWSDRGGIPEGSAIPWVAALAAADASNSNEARSWAGRAAKVDDPGISRAVEALAMSGELAIGDDTSPATACVNLHLRARRAEPVSLGRCGYEPLVVEAGTDNERRLYDPLIYNTLASVYRQRAVAAVGGKVYADALREAGAGENNLEAVLFSPFWLPADLAAEVARDPDLHTAGAGGPTLEALGLPLQIAASDDPQSARDLVRELDKQLDPWLVARREQADTDGRALLDELDLVAVFRTRVILAWARQALHTHRPHQARTLALLAMDLEHGREIGPRNPPGLYVVLAEANLRTGRTREALDALRPLLVSYPEVEGADETIGDLAILQGLSRQGDSKED